jgi:myosin heavy subunit
VCPEINGVDDRQEFDEMSDCMQSLGFSTEERNSVFKVVAGVLHLGDMEFQEHADSAEGTKIVDENKAGWICELFGVE